MTATIAILILVSASILSESYWWSVAALLVWVVCWGDQDDE